MKADDDAALDALAAVLAPRVLEKVRELLAAEQNDEHALGLAVMARLGFEPGPQGKPTPPPKPRAPRKR